MNKIPLENFNLKVPLDYPVYNTSYKKYLVAALKKSDVKYEYQPGDKNPILGYFRLYFVTVSQAAEVFGLAYFNYAQEQLAKV